jgi:hypothetical protein
MADRVTTADSDVNARATDSAVSAPSGATTAAQAAAARAAGARIRIVVRDTVLGTRAAASPMAQKPQSPIEATSCTSPLRGSRACPKEGPAMKGRVAQMRAGAQRPKLRDAGVIPMRFAYRGPSSLLSDLGHSFGLPVGEFAGAEGGG